METSVRTRQRRALRTEGWQTAGDVSQSDGALENGASLSDEKRLTRERRGESQREGGGLFGGRTRRGAGIGLSCRVRSVAHSRLVKGLAVAVRMKAHCRRNESL